MLVRPAALLRGLGLALLALVVLLGARGADDPPQKGDLTAAQKAKLKQSTKLGKQAHKLRADGKFKEALNAAEQVVAIQQEVLGRDSMRVANTYQFIAALQEDADNLPAARKAREEVLRIIIKTVGEEHKMVYDAQRAVEHIKALERLKPAQRERLREADRLDPTLRESHHNAAHAEIITQAQRSLAIRKEVLGEKDPEYLQSLARMAIIYSNRGEHAKAEVIHRQVLALRKEVLGTQHIDYARSLCSLGHEEMMQGEFARAEALYKQALPIIKEAVGEKKPDYLNTLRSLAKVYTEQEEYAKAEALLKQAQAIRKVIQGGSTAYGADIGHLGRLYRKQRDFAKAEQYYQEACAIRKARGGDKTLRYAASLSGLASTYLDQEKFDKAEPLLQQVHAIRKRSLGEKHPLYALGVYNLARLYDMKQENAKADPLYRQACGIVLEHLENSAEDQTEQTQLAHAASLRRNLDSYVHNSTKANTPAADVYAIVLAWKGAITARQRLARLARVGEKADPETARAFESLASVSRELARISLADGERGSGAETRGEDVAKRIQELTAEREKLEIQLSKQTAEFRRYHESRTLTPAGLQKLLPTGTVLVDFLNYSKGSTQRMVAFVITSDKIERVELGLSMKLPGAVDAFRAGVARRTQAVTGKDDPALVLRNKIWQPLEKYLTGAKLVLISPDGPLTQLPFGALPGKEEGRFLLEEVSLAVLPVPRMLPELLAKRSPERSKIPPSLFALGDADFDGNPAEKPKPEAEEPWTRTRTGERMNWTRLPGTRGELLAIEDTFHKAVPKGKLTALRDKEATEDAVRKLAPQHEYLHLATHGFFAPKNVRSAGQNTASGDSQGDQEPAPIGYHPGLLSGLALAGANKPTGDDDGVLTALEVAELDLSKVELAVLSACETGLGEVAGGEGVLGLQRAFQVAGARSTVTSFWKVDDQATRNLMERFYDNYWKKGMGAQEALREAQLVMLREGVKRGMVREEEGLKKESRTPPYYWAAFVLSGDWR